LRGFERAGGVSGLQQGGIASEIRALRLSCVTQGAYLAPMSADASHHRPWRRIDRRPSRKIRVGSVEVGGDAPITVQSMTNTLTADANATIGQIRQLEEAGADIVRVSCPDEDSTAAFRAIAKASKVPLVADIHFHYKRGIEAAEAGAACLRINPGNIGSPARVKEVVQAARDHGCSMRIGVNAGSLERDLLEKYGEPCPEAMVESALFHARILQDLDFHEFKISCKASDVFMTVAAYQQLADAVDCPLHLGVTEAGALRSGTIKSAIGIGSLLWAGIGDTIRVSLAADPVEEIKAGFDMLKSLGLRHRGVNIIACPSCARQGYNVIKTVETLEERLAHISTPLSLSIIGCVVNGPGEALMTDIGFTGGGAGSGMVYIDGKPDHKMGNDHMVDHIVELVEAKAKAIESAKAAAEPSLATVAAE
jgi:(E)-4-hydroxy-3-methylbut-2-enyl-diphosphate synthase